MTAIKSTGNVKDVCFALRHLAAWFGGRKIAEVSADELRAFKAKFYRKAVKV